MLVILVPYGLLGLYAASGQHPTQARLCTLPDMFPAHSDVSHFFDCIVEERESAMNIRQAALLTEVLLAGSQSTALGQVISLPLESPKN